MRLLSEKDYKTTAWSGGKTTQLAIGPEGADYADRDFLWRVSSAAVELPESDFTALPDYDRFITPIRGSMELARENGKKVLLAPFEIYAFDGAEHIRSRGICTDFNLMLRKGRCEGRMFPLFGPGDRSLSDNTEKSGFSPDILLVFCTEGSVRAEREGTVLTAEAGGTLLLEGKEDALRAALSAESGSRALAAAVRLRT